MRAPRSVYRLLAIAACTALAGCSAFPDIKHQPQFHNPFPQLSRVAVLPFYNQSADPTVDQDRVALAYASELQQIPGFEVMPVGVAKRALEASGIEPRSGEDYQRLARLLGVDAVVIGSVTEFSPYYPPRMGLAVRWYAANPGFYPIPPGYGLPWGTSHEELIPDRLVLEAELALAREQLRTQTPDFVAPAEWLWPRADSPPPADEPQRTPQDPAEEKAPQDPPEDAAEEQADDAPRAYRQVTRRQGGAAPEPLPLPLSSPSQPAARPPAAPPEPEPARAGADLPPDWPDPSGFVPPPPSPVRPVCLPQSEPVLSLTQLYQGNDADFTQRLANYFYFRDDARFGGWQAYLQRSDDFIRFCCHLHITEMLAARGGADKTRVVWRWPIGRYER